MKRILLYGFSLFFSLAFFACVEIEEHANTPRGNFDALWKIMDENYCFFEYKEVDWNQVYLDYSQRLKNNMSLRDFFMLMDEMLWELRDGHVNISTPFDLGRYWAWYEAHPANYQQELINSYLGTGTDYHIAGSVRYKILNDSVGYMRYADFSGAMGEANLDYVLYEFRDCPGIIIDVRNNGGGLLTNSDRLASRFFNKKTLVGYIQHKTGKGHNDFSKPFPKYVEPSPRLRYQKPVIVLTNRRCFSATNDFVNSMRYAPNVIILGDRTGGGSGLPFSSELPNGWSIRFSACPMYDADMQHIEFGIDPNIFVSLLEEDIQRGKDTLIEAARKILRE